MKSIYIEISICRESLPISVAAAEEREKEREMEGERAWKKLNVQ